MNLLSKNTRSKILTLIIFIVLLYVIKPSIAFKPNGASRCYGLGYDLEGYKKTLFNVQTIVIVVSILIYVN